MDQPQVSWGAPHAERADAARNRAHLLATARQMLAEQGPDQLTMDALAGPLLLYLSASDLNAAPQAAERIADS